MRSRLLMLACITALAACPQASPPPDASARVATPDGASAGNAGPSDPATSARAEASPTPEMTTTERTLSLPAGELAVGSRPGTPGRKPRREAALVPVAMDALDIDRRPFPGEGRPRLGLSSREAARLCDERGRRLCTELEWERACKRGGEAFETAGMEWTSSPGGASFGEAETRIARGGAEEPALRCSARRALERDATPRGIGFRCCGGGASAAAYPTPERSRAFRSVEVDEARLRDILASVPELARFAPDFQLFHRADADRALLRCHGTAVDLHGWEVADGVLEWAPGWGLPNWVFAGRSGDDALLIVLHRTGRGFVHAASYVYEGERASLALTYTPPSRTELHFSPSVGCLAEGGVVVAEEDGRVLAYHRRVGW